MKSAAPPPKELLFGPFRLDVLAEKLLRNGTAVRLQDQPLKLLLLLLERRGETVSRGEMRKRLWPRESFGDFDNGLNVAIKKLRTALGDDPDRPVYIETIPRRGYRFIAPVSEAVSPSPISAAALNQTPVSTPSSFSTPESAAAPAESPAWTEPPGRMARIVRFVIASFLIGLSLTAGVLLFLRRNHRNPPSFAPQTLAGRSRRAVAVLGFRNASARTEDAWLSTAMSEMLSTELAVGDQLRLIPEEDVIQTRPLQAAATSGSTSRDAARQLRVSLNADLLVSGSFVTVGQDPERQVRMDVRLQDTTSGEILAEFSESGSEPGLFRIVDTIGERLRQRLGVSNPSSEEHAQVLASMPSRQDAREYYSMGLLKFREYDALRAVDLLKKCVAVEPSFPLAHSALSAAWARLGYDQRALEEAEKADQLSNILLPTERLGVRARRLEANRQWDKAADAYRTLYTSFRDEAEYGLLLAHALVRAGRGQDAVSTLDGVRALQRSESIKAQIDLAAAEAHIAMGSFDRALTSSQAALAEARAQGQSLLLAHVLRTEGLIYENLNQYDSATAAIMESRILYQQAGDRFGVASVLEVEGNIFSDRGQLVQALDSYQAELKIVREIGNKRAEASTLNNSALVLYQKGDLASSNAMWEKARAAFHELGDKSNEAIVIVNIGGVLKDQGDLAAARSRYQDALALSREVHDASGSILALQGLATTYDAWADYANARKYLQQATQLDLASGHPAPSSESLLDLGDIEKHQGNLSAARKSYEDALSRSRQTGEKSWTAYALFGLGRVALLAADYTEAGNDLSQAMQIRRELGEPFSVAETELALAEEAMMQNPHADVSSTLQRVRDSFRNSGKLEQWIAAGVQLSRLRMVQGRIDDVQREIESLPPPGKIQEAESRWKVEILTSQLMSKRQKSAEARIILHSVIQETLSHGAPGEQFEARLALADTEPDRDRRKSDLERLSAEADKLGYHSISQSIRGDNP